jgi:hypothetical protein
MKIPLKHGDYYLAEDSAWIEIAGIAVYLHSDVEE